MSGTEWLSEGAEKLVSEIEAGEVGSEKNPVEILVVGSGYGGSVAAARLAGSLKAGGSEAVNVYVLERGREILPGGFPDRFAALPEHVRIQLQGGSKTIGPRDGLFDFRLGKDVSALLGNGLGGGSLINAGVLARADDVVLNLPCWPQQLRGGALNRHYDTAEKFLGANEIPDPEPKKLAALTAVGEKIDGKNFVHRAKIAVTFEEKKSAGRVLQKPCNRCGDCCTGCNHWAKNTLAMNYLPAAKADGARIFTGITVVSIRPDDAERDCPLWTLRLEFTDRTVAHRYETQSKGKASGTESSGAKKLKTVIEIFARHLILSAGTYGSTEILMRSDFPLSRQQLGRRFSTNGDMLAVGYKMNPIVNASAKETTAPNKRQVGPTITGMIDLRKNKSTFGGIVIEEFAIPAALRKLFEETITTFGGLYGLSRCDRSHHYKGLPGGDPAAVDPIAVEHTAVYGTMGHDGADGCMRISDNGGQGDSSIDVVWAGIGKHAVFKTAIAALRKGHEPPEIGGTVMPSPLWQPLPPAMQEILGGDFRGESILTVHPLGGCGMAETAEHGVVNHVGQVFKGDAGQAIYKNLVVLDGSIIPTSLGINPCLTIAALAEYASAELADQWTFSKNSAKTPSEPPPIPASSDFSLLTPPGPRRPTSIRFAERMTADSIDFSVNHGLEKFGVELTIKFDPIADLEAFTASPSKVVQMQTADLVLTAPKYWRCKEKGEPSNTTIRLKGRMTLLDTEESGPTRRIFRAAWAWLWNRGLRDIWPKLFNWRKGATSHWRSKLCGLIRDFVILASHVGEIRRLIYVLEVGGDVLFNGHTLLRRGDRLIGEKRLAYTCRAIPWHQLTRMRLCHESARIGSTTELGTLTVDPMYFVSDFVVQLQTIRQEDQPTAIADLLCFANYLARVIGGIHIWTFRKPDKPDHYPKYAGKWVDDRVLRVCEDRLVGEMEGIPKPVQIVVDACADFPKRQRDPAGQSKADAQSGSPFVLTRYQPRSENKREAFPVLLIHGYGASGTTFAYPKKNNLVQHLVHKGFDTWVVDLRTSIALDSSRHLNLTFEDIGDTDIQCAIAKIIEIAGLGEKRKVNVVAHCIGSAMFCMSALKGHLDGRVNAVVLSQVGPLIELPPLNRARGYVAGYLKHLLQWRNLDITAADTPLLQIIDRLLAAYPYPDYEWRVHHPYLPWQKVPHELFCNRANSIFGRLFEHAKMDGETLENLHALFGHVSIKTLKEAIFFATRGRITDRYGRNVFVNHQSLVDHFNFPVCLVHGEENAVFDCRGSEETYRMLKWVFDSRQAPSSTPRQEDRFRLERIKGYGHLDCMAGKNAHMDVFGKISEFLEAHPVAQPSAPAPLTKTVLRGPLLGPVVGWVRRMRPTNGDPQHLVNIMFVPDDLHSKPEFALTIVLRPKSNERLLESDRQFAMIHKLKQDPARKSEAGSSGDAAHTLKIKLPRKIADYTVLVLTLHIEPPEEKHDAHYWATGTVAISPQLENEQERLLSEEEFESFVEPLLTKSETNKVDERAFEAAHRHGRLTIDEDYKFAPFRAFISKECLEAAQDVDARDNTIRSVPSYAEDFSFAVGSCRYAASIFDRELADRGFGRLRELLDQSPRAGSPRLLLLNGDQIYADASLGLFDPTSGIERFDQRYLEAWSAPNARDVLRRLPTYMMLDDHEVQDNWETGAAYEQEGLRSFEAYQRGLAPRKPADLDGSRHAPYWYDFASGGYRFFVADTRAERKRAARSGRLNDKIFTDAQMKALTDWLETLPSGTKYDRNAPKFVISPSVAWPWPKAGRGSLSYALRQDGWDGYPVSLNKLLAHIAQHNIQNVVFLSGDYHCSMVSEMSLRMPGSCHVVKAFSIVSSGFYAPYPFANSTPDELQLAYDGTLANWLGISQNSHAFTQGEFVDVSIQYDTRNIVTQDNFALVKVRHLHDAALEMVVEFSTDSSSGDARSVFLLT